MRKLTFPYRDTRQTPDFHPYYNIGGFERLKAEGFPAELL